MSYESCIVQIQVFRSVTKLLLVVPSRPFQTCSHTTEILEDVPLRIYTPAIIKSDIAIVYYHGGEASCLTYLCLYRSL